MQGFQDEGANNSFFKLMQIPLLSVCMITYNHEKFIAQAIESVLMQKTNFPFELVIGEDKSTDITREVCLKYLKDNPEKIKLFAHENNLGMIPNFLTIVKECKGKYIAILDGDDYWTSPDKLQKQVDFMENNPDYSICFHNAIILSEPDNNLVPFFRRPLNKSTFTIKDILRKNFIPTLSCLYRRTFLNDFPVWFAGAMPGDWFIYILCAQHGPLKYIDEIMGTYRIHAGGNYSGPPQIRNFEKTVKSLEALYSEIDIKYKRELRKTLSKKYFSLGKLLLKNGSKKEAYSNTIKSIKIFPRKVLDVPHEYLKFFLLYILSSR